MKSKLTKRPFLKLYFLVPLSVETEQERLVDHEMMEALQPGSSSFSCGCLQTCTDLQYRAERSRLAEDYQGYSGWRMAYITVFFKKKTFLARVRSELYGPMDFLASCGSLLGLGLGFSALSLVELLYWLFLRACCSRRKHCSTVPHQTWKGECSKVSKTSLSVIGLR